MARQPLTHSFRKRMFRDAAIMAFALAVLLAILMRTLDSKHFALAALILIPVSAITFNLFERRAYAAQHQGKR